MKAALICALGFAIASAVFAKATALSIDPKLPSEQSVKAVGDSLSLPCTVVGEGFDPWMNTITWYKVTQDNEEIMINSNAAVNKPFQQTGRYEMLRERPDGAVRITLNVKNITLAENGTYKCMLKEESTVLSETVHDVLVPAPVDDLILTTNNSRTRVEGNTTFTTFDFEKLKPAYVSCSSKGGNPMPSLKLYRGRTEVTDEFEHRIIDTRIGEKGLEEVRYEIQLVKSDFMATPDYSGHNLKCVSRVPRSGKSDTMPGHKQTRVATMEVTYPPEFECSREWAAFVATEQFAIQCSVHANPQVDIDQLSWKVGDVVNGTEIAVGNSVDGLSANVSIDRATAKVRVSLTIDSVNTTHFQNYILRARNNLGERHFYATLSLATTTISTTTVEPPPKVINQGNSNNPPYKADESKPLVTTGSAVNIQASGVVTSLLVLLSIATAAAFTKLEL